MPTLPRKKVGLISCSGEDLPEGTVSRMATLKVLEELRPADTVTLCLPLFLAGEERERAFARFYPTIAIDGCEKRCAARATETYSAPPAASVVVSEIVTAQGLPRPGFVRRLDAPATQLVEVVARDLANEVDRLLGKRATESDGANAAMERDGATAVMDPGTTEGLAESVVATCSCTAGVPVGRVSVGGRTVDLVALPAIFDLLRQQGKAPGDEAADELMELVRIYNPTATGDESALRAAVLREYAAYCDQQTG